MCPPSVRAAGVTLMTHGNNSNADTWVLGMAEKTLSYPSRSGTNVTLYSVFFIQTNGTYVPTWQRLGGNHPLSTDSGEIVVKLDWRDPVNDLPTVQVGPVVAYTVFIQTNFISELNGRALAEFPIHLIGHSRGGSLISEIAKFLGSYGIWVDHTTFLDSFSNSSDGPVRVYENILFADNYYQRVNTIFVLSDIVAGAYNRKLTNLGPGGYTGIYEGHSDVHLWYHATIDWVTPTTDYSVNFTSNERNVWFSSFEAKGTNAGFYYSRVGMGNRLATNNPAHTNSGAPVDGFNRKWGLGAPIANNRSILPNHEGSGNWPNPITVELARTNLMHCGDSNSVSFRYQWADFSSNRATVELWLDRDHNPLNGNEFRVASTNVSGTGQGQIGSGSFNFHANFGTIPSGNLYPFVLMKDRNRRRHLYTDESYCFSGDCFAPTNRIERLTGQMVRITVTARTGDVVVLEQTQDLRLWQPVSTNTFTSSSWVLTNASGGTRFFRSFVR